MEHKKDHPMIAFLKEKAEAEIKINEILQKLQDRLVEVTKGKAEVGAMVFEGSGGYSPHSFKDNDKLFVINCCLGTEWFEDEV